MKAIDFLKRFVLPASVENRPPLHPPSNSEVKRWFENKAIVINGKTPHHQDEISFPVRQLIFFPNGKKENYI